LYQQKDIIQWDFGGKHTLGQTQTILLVMYPYHGYHSCFAQKNPKEILLMIQ
jgi:hypothetical protein